MAAAATCRKLCGIVAVGESAAIANESVTVTVIVIVIVNVNGCWNSNESVI